MDYYSGQSKLSSKANKVSNLQKTSSFNQDVQNFTDDLGEFEKTVKSTESKVKVEVFPNLESIQISYGKTGFVFSSVMLEVPLVKTVYDKLIEKHGVSESKGLTKYRRVSRNSTLLKKFEELGFSCIKPVLKSLSDTYSQEQLHLLTSYFFSKVMRDGGYSKVEFHLNTDTEYFRRKAQTLAQLQNGVGKWFLSGIDYHPDKNGLCTMGHELKWEFIVKEEQSGQTLSFGTSCVEDFFQVDLGLKQRLGNHKEALLGYLIDYAFYLNSAVKLSYSIDAWSWAFTYNYIRYSEQLQLVHNQYAEFIKNRVLVPESLQSDLVEALPSEAFLNSKSNYSFSVLRDIFGNDYQALATLGILGNQTFDVDSAESYNPSSNGKPKYKLGLHGAIIRNPDKFRDSLKMLQVVGLKDTFKESIIEVLTHLFQITHLSHFTTMASNLFNFQTYLQTLRDQRDLTIKSPYSVLYKGIQINNDTGLKPIELIALWNETEIDLYSNEPWVLSKLKFSNLPKSEFRNALIFVSKYFKASNTVNNRLDTMRLKNLAYYKPELQYLIKEARKLIFPSKLLDSYYIGSLKEEVLQEMLEKLLGYQPGEVSDIVKRIQEDKERLQSAKQTSVKPANDIPEEEKKVLVFNLNVPYPYYKGGFVYDDYPINKEQSVLNKWNKTSVSRSTLVGYLNLFEQQFKAGNKQYDFAIKVGTSVLVSGQASDKQKSILNRAVYGLLKEIANDLSIYSLPNMRGFGNEISDRPSAYMSLVGMTMFPANYNQLKRKFIELYPKGE